ncbi:hypothetical protein KC19_4G207300 [Ceratodon purpureus]|uniref:Secreted protein n=1 Tax=Ceratodon purpureus TaxID=3225 RepID=A0A8T0IDG0_CERPU|nr:hypothetical protein KC19_4G207300 [Ceratodon purpureus]
MYKLSITLSFILRSTLSSCRAFCQSSDVQYTRVSQTISSANWLAPDLAPHLAVFTTLLLFHVFRLCVSIHSHGNWIHRRSAILYVPLGASKAHVPAGAAFGSRLESYAQRPDAKNGGWFTIPDVFHPQLTHSPPFSPVAVKQDWLAPCEVLSWPSFSSTTVKLMPVV